MQKINLYRYETNGRVTITPNQKNEQDLPSRLRLIADEGNVLTNGELSVPARDVLLEEVDIWSEVVQEEPQSDIELKAQAYDILMGVSE